MFSSLSVSHGWTFGKLIQTEVLDDPYGTKHRLFIATIFLQITFSSSFSVYFIPSILLLASLCDRGLQPSWPPLRDLLYSLSFWCFTSPNHTSHHWMCTCVPLCCSPVALLYPLASPRSYLLITQCPSSSIPLPLYMMEQMHSFPLNLAGIQKLTAADNVTTIQQRATEREKEKQRMMIQRKKKKQ